MAPAESTSANSNTKELLWKIGTILAKDFKVKILRKIYFTKGARFTCHKRLHQQSKIASFAIAWLSILVTSFSIVLIVFSNHIEEFHSVVFATGTVILSLSILVIAITEDTWNKALIASEMHRCAMELNRLYDKIEFVCLEKSALGQSDFHDAPLKEYIDEYHEILGRCSFNHSTVDRDRFLAENCEEIYGNGWWWNTRFRIKKSIPYFIVLWSSTLWAFALSMAALSTFIWLMLT